MKTNLYVEYRGKKVVTKSMADRAKDKWKEIGGKVKDIETLDIYFKPDEDMCYYVINDTENGSFPAEIQEQI